MLFAPAALVEGLGTQGWAVEHGWVDDDDVGALRARALELHAAGDFHAAAVGSGARRAVRPEIRSDQIRWLLAAETPAEKRLLARFEDLRLALNRALTLGLFEFECHYALYPPGASYARHLDQFVADGRRVVSTVLYLNDGWRADDGGELRLYVDREQPAADGVVDILPGGGTLVLFLSERFWHEVRPTQRARLSLTGWFRRRD